MWPQHEPSARAPLLIIFEHFVIVMEGGAINVAWMTSDHCWFSQLMSFVFAFSTKTLRGLIILHIRDWKRGDCDLVLVEGEKPITLPLPVRLQRCSHTHTTWAQRHAHMNTLDIKHVLCTCTHWVSWLGKQPNSLCSRAINDDVWSRSSFCDNRSSSFSPLCIAGH